MIKKILVGLLMVLIVLQFIRPEKNLSGNTTKDITTIYPMSDSVKLVFDKACADCHTNKTNYPWYTAIEPIGYWTANHVKDGKRHFNLNEFAGYRIGKQNKKLEECIEQIKEGEMPLESYTWIHKEAKLTEAEKQKLYDWCGAVRDSIKARYPADSLVLPKRK